LVNILEATSHLIYLTPCDWSITRCCQRFQVN